MWLVATVLVQSHLQSSIEIDIEIDRKRKGGHERKRERVWREEGERRRERKTEQVYGLGLEVKYRGSSLSCIPLYSHQNNVIWLHCIPQSEVQVCARKRADGFGENLANLCHHKSGRREWQYLVISSLGWALGDSIGRWHQRGWAASGRVVLWLRFREGISL